jgi:hypothetical protein
LYRKRDVLLNWWLAVPWTRTTTPNWDIASTCLIHGKPGILLIEAKAHDAELRNEERGKPLGSEDNKGVSIDSRRNHVRIGCSIQEAALALSQETGLSWALSRDWCYQMSNRLAWAWKLAELRPREKKTCTQLAQSTAFQIAFLVLFSALDYYVFTTFWFFALAQGFERDYQISG